MQRKSRRIPAMAVPAIRFILSLRYRDTAAIGAERFSLCFTRKTYEFGGTPMFIESMRLYKQELRRSGIHLHAAPPEQITLIFSFYKHAAPPGLNSAILQYANGIDFLHNPCRFG